jgi:DHA1 family bicyclomycin/chloramphenicol resistance-like MFS transporter
VPSSTRRPREDRTGARGRVGAATVLVLGALGAFGPISLDLYLPGLPGLADDLGARPWAAQLTLTACLLGLATGQLIVGPWSDAVGRRRPLVVGVGAYVAASLACAAAPSVQALVGLRFVQGFAGAAGIVVSRAVVRDLRSGAEAARLYAGLLLVSGLAPVLAPVLGGQALRVIDWRGLFAVLAAVGAVVLAGALLLVPESHPPALRRPGGLGGTLRVFRRLLGGRRFVGCVLASGLAFAALFAYIAGSPFVLQDVYALSPSQFSAVFAVNAVGLVAAGQASSPLIARFGPRPVLGAGLAVGAVGGLALLLVVTAGGIGLAGILPALFLVVSSIGAVLPSGTAIALEGSASTAGSAAGLLGLAQFSVGAAAAPLVGVAGSTALPMAVVIAVCALAALASYGLLVRPRAGAPVTTVAV